MIFLYFNLFLFSVLVPFYLFVSQKLFFSLFLTKVLTSLDPHFLGYFVFALFLSYKLLSVSIQRRGVVLVPKRKSTLLFAIKLGITITTSHVSQIVVTHPSSTPAILARATIAICKSLTQPQECNCYKGKSPQLLLPLTFPPFVACVSDVYAQNSDYYPQFFLR